MKVELVLTGVVAVSPGGWDDCTVPAALVVAITTAVDPV